MHSFAAAIMWARITIHTHSENRIIIISLDIKFWSWKYNLMYSMYCMYVYGKYCTSESSMYVCMYVCMYAEESTNGGFVVLWTHGGGDVNSAGAVASPQCNTLRRAVSDAWQKRIAFTHDECMYTYMNEFLLICLYICMYYACMHAFMHARFSTCFASY